MMTGALLACALLLAGQEAGAPAQPTQELPVSLDRIQRALAGPPPIQLKEQQPVFRLEVFGRKPTIEDILGENFWVGPAPYGSMTHREFLDFVTPKMAQPYQGFSGGHLLAQAALTLVQEWALKSALKKFRQALTTRERESARKEVMEALAALEKARREAGLPPSATPKSRDR